VAAHPPAHGHTHAAAGRTLGSIPTMRMLTPAYHGMQNACHIDIDMVASKVLWELHKGASITPPEPGVQPRHPHGAKRDGRMGQAPQTLVSRRQQATHSTRSASRFLLAQSLC
jgi:hypothetical protein